MSQSANARYLGQFMEGIELAGTIDEAFRRDRGRLEGFKDYIRDSTSGRHEGVYSKVVPMIAKLAYSFVSVLDPIDFIGRRCHTVSDKFNRHWHGSFGDGKIWLLLTVGDVRYKGESVYGITLRKVEDCASLGFRPDEPLDVHVWLTLEDMTIFDLTIMASLLRLGWVTREQYDAMPVVVVKPGEPADFEYVPFLVDNDFVSRVDG